MKNGRTLGQSGRFTQLEPVIRRTFDIPSMARLSVGPSWATLTEAQRQQVTESFGRYISAIYADRFDSYAGQKLQVIGEQPAVAGIMVRSQIVKANGEPVNVDYMMRRNGDSWLISDIYLDGAINPPRHRLVEPEALFADGGEAQERPHRVIAASSHHRGRCGETTPGEPSARSGGLATAAIARRGYALHPRSRQIVEIDIGERIDDQVGRLQPGGSARHRVGNRDAGQPGCLGGGDAARRVLERDRSPGLEVEDRQRLQVERRVRLAAVPVALADTSASKRNVHPARAR